MESVKQWRKLIRDSKQEDGPDNKAVGRRERGDDGLDSRTVGGRGEYPRSGCGHQRVHQQQPHDKTEKTNETAAGAAQIRREEKEQKLRRCLRTQAMDNAYNEDGTLIVLKGERLWPGRIGIKAALNMPAGISRSRDKQGDAAAGNVMMMFLAAAEKRDHDVECKQDQRGADETLADGVQVPGQREVQKDDGRPEQGNGERMAQRIQQTQLHAFTPVALNAGDVGDSGQVVVVEAVAKPEKKTGEECELERRRHARSKVRFGDVGRKGQWRPVGARTSLTIE